MSHAIALGLPGGIISKPKNADFWEVLCIQRVKCNHKRLRHA